jgi:steroid 5-alpha reductase family enzyme
MFPSLDAPRAWNEPAPHVHTFHDALHDEHVFVGLAVVFCAVLNLAACVISKRRNSGRTFEALSGITVGLAVLASCALRGTYFPRQIVVTCLVLAWGTRLSLYLYVRNLETPLSGDAVSARTLWAVTCAVPAVLINALQHDRKAFDVTELAGIVVAVSSLAVETLADLQKARWHKRHAATSRPGKDSTLPPVCANGLWALSRHPNLCAEMAFHAGVYIVAAPVLPPWVAAFPTLLALQIFFLRGGVAHQERQRAFMFQFFPAYVAYKQATSPLLLIPPALWRAVPAALKSTLLLELSMYDEYDREMVAEVDAMRKAMRRSPPEEQHGDAEAQTAPSVEPTM